MYGEYLLLAWLSPSGDRQILKAATFLFHFYNLSSLSLNTCQHDRIYMYIIIQSKDKNIFFLESRSIYTTAKKKRPNQLGYLVGIWL